MGIATFIFLALVYGLAVPMLFSEASTLAVVLALVVAVFAPLACLKPVQFILKKESQPDA